MLWLLAAFLQIWDKILGLVIFIVNIRNSFHVKHGLTPSWAGILSIPNLGAHACFVKDGGPL